MYFALVAFACLLLGHVWRRLHRLEAVQQWLLAHRPHALSPTCWIHACQYYFLLHLALCGLFTWDFIRFFRLINGEPHLPEALGEAERRALALPWWLRRMALCSPACVLLTLLTSAWHTARYVRSGLTQQRDRTV